MLIRCTCGSNSQTLCMRNQFQCKPEWTQSELAPGRKSPPVFCKHPPIVLHGILEFCLIEIWSLMLKSQKHVVQFTTIYTIKDRKIRKHLTLDSTGCLVHTLVMGRVDYCNSLLYGPRNNINKLQRVQNMAARLITNTPRFCHITPVLCQLHWLPIGVRIKVSVNENFSTLLDFGFFWIFGMNGS